MMGLPVEEGYDEAFDLICTLPTNSHLGDPKTAAAFIGVNQYVLQKHQLT